MFGQLIPLGGGLPIQLLKETIVIGRLPNCDVVIPSRAVSSRHCKLILKDRYWWVKDLDSRNGTGIDGIKCQQKRILPEQVLCVPKMRFKIVYDAPEVRRNISDDSLAMRALNDADASLTTSTVVERTEAGKTATVDAPRPATARPTQPLPPTIRKSAPALAKNIKRYLGKLMPKGGGDPIALLEPKLIIGRSRQAQIRIKLATVSSRHCALTWEDGFWFAEDLNSSNGIRVNGEKVDRKILMPGDDLSVSKQRFTIDYISEGEPPVDPGIISKSLLEKAGLQNVLDSKVAPGWITAHEEKESDKPRRYRLDESDPD